MSAHTASTTTYSADLVALIALGPVEFLDSIFFSNCWAYSGRIERVVTSNNITTVRDCVDLAVAGAATARFYFGTPTQQPDPYLSDPALAPGQSIHPSYKHQCYLRLTQFSLGNSPAAPTGQLIIGRYPQPAWLDYSAGQNRIGDDANPAHIIAELLTSTRFGLGLPASQMNVDSFASAAQRFIDAQYGMSVYIQRQEPVQQLIVEICEYFGGILRDNGGQAELFIPSAGDAGDAPLLTAAHYVEEPKFDFGSWADTLNQLNVMYSEPAIYLQPSLWIVMNDANMALVGEQRLLTNERGWLTSQANADLYGKAVLAVKSKPIATCSCKVLASAVEGLLPGDAIRATVPDTGDVLTFRITSMAEETAGAQSVSLELSQDYSDVLP
jgi:hypothetical protein